MPEETFGEFLKGIAESDFANIAGAAGDMAAFSKFLIELFSEDSTEKILDRIDKLNDSLNRGVSYLGRLINQQTAIIHQEFDQLKNEDAIAHASAAMNLLFSYEDLGSIEDVVEAEGLSSLATALLLQQEEPFFIGGLITAGNVRIDVIRARDPRFFTKDYWKDEIYRLADRLEYMISVIKQRVDQSHTIGWTKEWEDDGPPPEQGGAYWHYSMVHKSHGVIIDAFTYRPSDDRSRRQASREAESARTNGVAAELAALGIPKFEEVAKVWRSVPEEHMRRSSIRQILRRPARHLDGQLTIRRSFHAGRRSARRSSMETEEATSVTYKVSPSSRARRFAEAFSADCRPFVIALITSEEFYKKFVEPDAQPEQCIRLAVERALGRSVKEDEARLLVEIQNYLGFDGLAAALIYSNEYRERFGMGVPLSDQEQKDLAEADTQC